MGARTDTRQRMVTTAALLLRERGVAGTTVAGVLERSGGPRGSVGFHFPGGRTELLADAVRWVGALVDERLGDGIDAGADPSTLYRGICEHYRSQLESTDYTAACPVWAVVQESYADPELGPVVSDIVDTWIEKLTRSLIDHGHGAPQAEDLAVMSIATLEGAITLARLRRTSRPITLAYASMEPHLSAVA